MKQRILAVAIAAMVVPGVAFAGGVDNTKPGSFYIGASFGKVTVDTLPVSINPSNVDDSDSIVKFFGGYNISSNLAVEANYYGKGDFIDGDGDPFKANAFAVYAVGKYPVADKFNIFGKLGFASWEVKYSGPTFNATFDGTDLAYGIGASYSFSKNLAVRAEYEVIDMDGPDASYLSVGVQYTF